MRRFLPAAACVALLLVVTSPAMAQTEEVSNAGLRFNISPPGARTLAMGGAFLALADDATASFANPAGLTKLLEREVSAEGRFWSIFHEFPDRGRLNGPPTGRGVDTYDDIVGPSTTRDDSVRASTVGRANSAALSYGSVVFPLENIVLSAYYHQPLKIDYQFLGQGAFYNQVGSSSDPGRTQPYGVAGNYDVRAAGVGLGFALSDNISVGASVAMNFFSAGVSTIFYTRPDDLNRPQFPDRFDPTEPVGPGDTEGTVRVTVDDSSTAISFNAGLTWNISPTFAFGAVYRHGASFDYDVAYNAVVKQPDGSNALVPATGIQAKFNVPHVYGAGLAWLPSVNWRVSVDYLRIQYSRLTDDFSSVYATDLNIARPEYDDVDEIDMFDPSTFNASDFVASDGNEIHVGFEYGFFNISQPFFLRWGFYTEADPRIRYMGPSERPGQVVWRDFYWNDEFDTGTRYHGTIGFGVPFSTFQFDMAVDYSEQATVGSVSAVYRF